MALSREIQKSLNAFCSIFDLSSFKNSLKSKISANIICKDNIKSIETCLKSLDGVVDEIVAVDGGSTDGTLEILEKYNCKIINNHDWQGYSHQRNLAIENSTGAWILVLDSDELLSQDLRSQLRQLVSSKIYSGYRFYRRWIDNLESPSYINATEVRGRYKPCLRLFKKSPETKYLGDLHESVHGLEKLRVKKFTPNKCYLYHLDVAINSFEERFNKVLERNLAHKGAGHPEEYLPELFNYEKHPLDPKDCSLV